MPSPDKYTAAHRLTQGVALSLCLSLGVNALAEEAQTQPSPPSQEASIYYGQEAIQGFLASFRAAKSHDPQLRKAYQTQKAEQEEANLSVSRLRPEMRLTANYQYERSDNIYTDDNSSFYEENNERSGGVLDDHTWRVNVRQPLFDYTAYQDYRRDQALGKAAGYRYLRAEQELVYRVSEQYLKVLLAAQKVYLNKQKLDALEAKQIQAKRALELKVGDALSVLSVRAARDLSQSDLLQAKSELNDAKTLLTNITGTEVSFPQRWVESSDHFDFNLLSGSQEEWLLSASGNLNIRAAQTQVYQEERNLAARKAEHYPVVSLNLSHSERKSDDEFRVRTDSIAAIELSMPIYSGGRTQANARKARARLEATRAQLDVVRAEKEQQIKLSYNRMVSFTERLTALAQSRESSQRYLEAAERQQSLKLGDQTTVLDARTKLVDTKLQFAQTLNDYLLSDLIIRLETGRLNRQRLETYDQLFNNSIATH